MILNKDAATIVKMAEESLVNSFISKVPTYYNYKRYIAFTLAEVLIVLFVIGVTSSLVIPGIIQDSQNAELKAAYKNAFADASQSLMRARTNNELVDIKGDSSNIVSNIRILEKYFSVTKSCTDAVAQGCWVDNCIAGEQDCFWSMPADNRQGKSEGFIDSAGRSWIFYNIDYSWFIMLVDTNGAKTPNRLGRDRFPLFFYDANNAANAKIPVKIRPFMDIISPVSTECTFGNCYFTSWLN